MHPMDPDYTYEEWIEKLAYSNLCSSNIWREPTRKEIENEIRKIEEGEEDEA